MSLDPGRLRHRVKLQSLTRTPDAGGGYTETMTDVATVWAQVEPLEGTEQLRAMQVSPTLSHRIRMRYKANVTPAMQAVYNGRTFDITSVIDPGERHREIELLVEERR